MPRNLTPGIEGARFGMLKVLGRVQVTHLGRNKLHWNCLCDCGRFTLVRDSHHLTSGKRVSCGCTCRRPEGVKKTLPKLEDPAGLRFGALVAVELSHVENYNEYWIFRCDCGELTHKRLDNVRRGSGQSCGVCSKLNNISTALKERTNA